MCFAGRNVASGVLLTQQGRRPILELLLDQASTAFNVRGVSGTRLGDIATQVGINRQAIYQWVRGREDLVFLTYMRACERVREQLAAALRLPGSAMDRVQALVRARLEGPAEAALTEVASLPPAKAATVRSAHDANVQRLAALIAAGIEEGTIASIDPYVAAQAIEGAVAWVSVRARSGPGLGRDEVMRGLTDWIRRGRAPLDVARTDTFRRPSAHLEDLSELFSKRGENTFDALLTAATRMFNQQGVVGSSVDSIAGTLGITKGAFYHNFSSKDELLYLVLKRSLSIARRNRILADLEGRTGAEKAQLSLHHTVHAHLGPFGPLALYTEVSALPEALAAEIREATSKSVEDLRGFVRTAIVDGTMRPHAVEAVQIAAAGMVNWLPTWLELSRTHDAGKFSDTFNAIAAFGLATDRR